MTAQEWYQRSKSIEINGLNVAYQLAGSGPVLICIHGFPSSSWDFEKLLARLSAHFTVVAPDLIGLGMSSKPRQPITVRLQANMIEALLRKIFPHQPEASGDPSKEADYLPTAHILAHDLGDTVAQELLARQVEGSSAIRCNSCVLLNGGIFPEAHRPLLIQKVLISPLGSIAVHLMTKRAFARQMTHVFSDKHPPTQAFLDDTWELIVYEDGRQAIPRLIRYMAERRQNRDRWVGALQKTLVPLRLINGLEDPISGAHAADQFEALIPGADVVRIPDAGHYPHVERPDVVWEAIQAFHRANK